MSNFRLIYCLCNILTGFGASFNWNLLLLAVGALKGAESGLGHLDGLLFLGHDSCLDQLDHLLLVAGEATDLSDDFTNARDSLGETSTAEGLLGLEGVGGLGWLGNDEAFV